MSRANLANYLDLNPETLRGTLLELALCGWITTPGRGIEIRDLEGLRRFADG